MLREKPPLRIIAPGRVYRSDSDQTHTPMFHQVEGLAIDEETHLGHLKFVLEEFCKAFFEVPQVKMRFRASYFPFTEPSMEVDIGYAMEYPNGKVALRDVDLVIPEGDFVFLVGPSGAGKSTLIKLLIRDEVATKGAVVLDGQDVARLGRRQVPKMRRKIGIIFQDFKLLPNKNVWENVAFALEVTGTPRRKIRPAVDRVLALVGLTAQAQQRPSQLSGGEQQRTAIARALVHDPRLIIADEPTGNLDPLISWEILQLLLRINELGVTVMMATHNAEVVTALRKRVVALEEGRIIRDEVGGAYHRED